MDSFNYGETPAEKPPAYRKWPTEGECTGLVDGDLIPYIVGYCIDEEAQFRLNKQIERGVPVEQTDEYAAAIDHLDEMLNDWLAKAGCDSMRVYLTGDSNFRDDIAFTRKYKDRDGTKPPLFYELRSYLLDKHGAILSQGCEADDLLSLELWEENRELEAQGVEVGTEAHHNLATRICISTDKDLRMVPGIHYNPHPTKQRFYRVSKLGELYPHWETKVSEKTGKETVRLKKLEGVGLVWFYAQIIMGDTVDTYPGIPGAGAAKAYDELSQCTSEEQMYLRTLELYKKKYRSPHKASNYRDGTTVMELSPYQMMLEQGRLAWMQTRPGEIWRSHSKLPRGNDSRWWQGGTATESEGEYEHTQTD